MSYYKTGEVREKGFFQNDKREGEFVSYYRNGKIRAKALYRNDRLVGEFKTFDREGRLLTGEGKEDEEAAIVEEEAIEEKNKEFDDMLKSLKASEE